MKITLEFEHPCELIDLLEKLIDKLVKPTPIPSVFKRVRGTIKSKQKLFTGVRHNNA